MNGKEIKYSMKLSKLKLNPSNPRTIKDDKFKKLIKSIQEFPEMMEKRPIVCVTDEDGLKYPLGGNMRLKALKELKYKEIPDTWVVIADEWTEEQRKQFIIKDNTNFGGWNFEELIEGWDVDDLGEWGVDVPNKWKVEEAVEDDFDTETKNETDIILGDLFEIGEHRLLCGDSTDAHIVERLFEKEKSDMIFTDPPYDFEDDSLYSSIIKDFSENAHIFVMHDDRGLLSYLRNSTLEFNRFFVADFKFSSPRGNDPYLRHILISHEKNGEPISHQNLHDGFSSIIKMDYRKNIKEEVLHKHQKSISFLANFINHYSKEKHIVFDLFLGSGSTMLASHQLNRKCYGMELNPQYCDVVVRRMLTFDKSLKIKRNGVDETQKWLYKL